MSLFGELDVTTAIRERNISGHGNKTQPHGKGAKTGVRVHFL
jgi:hypothetical protein